MVTVTIPHYLETRVWLADALDETARWRDDKATEYPDDPRNVRSAIALRQAAHHVRGLNDDLEVRQIAALVEDCLASGIDLLAQPSFPGSETERVAGRYRFDRFGVLPSAADHAQLLTDLYGAMLRDLCELDVNPGSPLGRRLIQETALVPRPAEPEAPPSVLIARLDELSRIADLLIEIAAAARNEADEDGKLPGPMQPTMLPLIRRRLDVSLAAASALGVPELEHCRAVVEQPPRLASQTISGVISAIEDVQRTIKAWR